MVLFAKVNGWGGQCLIWPTAESWYTKGKAHTTEGASSE